MPISPKEASMFDALLRLPPRLIQELDPAQPPAKVALFLRHAATRQELQWVLIETLHRLEQGPADPDAPEHDRPVPGGVDHA